MFYGTQCVCVSLSVCVLWRRQRNDAAINDVLAVFVNMTSDPTSLSANQISAIVDALQNVVDSVAAKPEQVNLLDCVTLYWRLFAHIDWACEILFRYCRYSAGCIWLPISGLYCSNKVFNLVRRTYVSVAGLWAIADTLSDKKLCYRRGTARRAVSVETVRNVA